MREILESCVRIDRTVARLYKDMQERCDHKGVAECLGRMAMEADSHAGWWRDLIRAYDAGLLPDLWDDTEQVRARMSGTIATVKSAVHGSGRLCGDDALAAAAATELFRRLFTAIDEHGTGGAERLLGVQLRRAWRDRVADPVKLTAASPAV